jgi:uncharacterized protein YbaR (Trm112 family)
MHKYMLPMLECPACHGKLEWTVTESDGEHVEKTEAICTSCAAVYPVHEGIGIFLTPDLQRQDLREEASR